MNMGKSQQQLDLMHIRIDRLHAQAADLPPEEQHVIGEALEELAVSLEELQVAEEELQEQNENLRATQQLLEKEQQRYQDLFHLAPDGYFVTDVHGVIVEANHAAASILNVSPQRLVGKPFALYVDPNQRRLFRQKLNLLPGSVKTQHWEVTLHTRNGETLDAEVTVAPLRDQDASLSGFRWIVRDIGERKRAGAHIRALNATLEQRVQERTGQLEASEARFRAIFEQAGVGMAHTGLDGHYLRVNTRFCQFLGYTPDELLARTTWDIAHPDDVQHDQASMNRLLNGELDTYSQERRYIRKDGVPVWGHLTRTLLYDAAGRPESIITVVEDITARKLAEQERDHLLALERTARADAEAAQCRTALLAEANTLLAASPDYDTALNNLAHLLVPVLGDYCIIDVAEGDDVRHAAGVHADPAGQPALDELCRRFPVSWTAPQGTLRLIRAGTPLIAQDVSMDDVRDYIGDEALTALIEQVGMGAVLIVPLATEGRAVGAIHLVRTQPGSRYSSEDVSLALDLAWRVAVSVDKARLYQQAQETLRALTEQRTLLETILNQAADAIMVCDRDGRLLYHSATAERLAGARLNTNGLSPVVWGQSYYPDGRPVPPEEMSLELALSGETTVGRQIHLVRPDGTSYDVLISAAPLRDERDDIIGAVATFMDITDRKKAEQHLQDALERTKELYQISRLIGVVHTPDDILRALLLSNHLQRVNRAAILRFDTPWHDTPPVACRVLASWRADSHLSKIEGQIYPFATYGFAALFQRDQPIHIEDVAADPRLNEAARNLFNLLKARDLILFPLIAAGQWYGTLMLHSGAPRAISNEDLRHIRGLVDQAAVAIYNIQLLETEAQARQEAERANQLRLKFLAMISHELRTPLTSIKGFATTLLAPDVSWDEVSQRDFITTIDEEADKLTEMIEQLLDLSRLDAGLLRVQPAPCALSDIVLATMSQLQAMTSNHTLNMHIPDDLPPVKADAQRVAQVLTNLVDNAAKYSPRQSDIAIRAFAEGDSVQVDVSDQGIGIPPEERIYIFEAFRRGEGDSNKRTKGAGLGLAICKGLIEAHGGRIWIQERDGPGTTASFTLPVASTV